MDVFEKVKTAIVSELGCDESKVTLDANLKDDLGADSIDAVQIIMELEDAFGISIDTDDIESISTVGKIVEYINNLIK